ncbi:transposase [Streptomyces sp. RB17]|uniref:transposase n=1 Tax=Streptomyces sp. RB17 TaxID=2585197 RepID=UPI0012960918|nr:transposase [Streptomyces sp. RB17]
MLANLARGAMRRKHADLVEALTGNFTDHHGFMVRVLIRAIRDASARIATLEEEIKQQITPFHRQVELLITIPGISTTVAHVMIAEMGADMSRFPIAVHLAAWAGLAPGNRESAGKRKRAPTRHGNVWLKAGLGVAALAVGRTKSTYLAAQHHRLRPRRGEKRTIVAVAHSMLVSAYHMLANDVPYQDLGPDYFTRRLGEERHRRRLLAQLGALGYDVTLPEGDFQESHFGASLEDHGPNVVLYRGGPQTARRAGSLRGHDHSRQSSSRPKSLRRPLGTVHHEGRRVSRHPAAETRPDQARPASTMLVTCRT